MNLWIMPRLPLWKRVWLRLTRRWRNKATRSRLRTPMGANDGSFASEIKLTDTITWSNQVTDYDAGAGL